MNDRMRRVALVTGASAGIGRATAKRLAAAGLEVFGAARRLDALESLAREVPGIHPLSLDVTCDDSVRAALDRLAADGVSIDVLVNNAGYGQMGAVEDVPLDRLRAQFEVNVFGAVRMIRALLPSMRSRRRGRIVNVSSPAGVATMPLSGAYCASKAALESLSSALRMEVRDFGIEVVVVRPGAIVTEFQEVAREGSDDLGASSPYADVYRGMERMFAEMTKRGSPPEPVADAIAAVALAARPPLEVNVPLDAKAAVALSAIVPTSVREGILRFGLKRLA